MDELTMAQAYILNEIRRIGICAVDNKIILDAWSIAARMKAEAYKRKEKGLPEAIRFERSEAVSSVVELAEKQGLLKRGSWDDE